MWSKSNGQICVTTSKPGYDGKEKDPGGVHFETFLFTSLGHYLISDDWDRKPLDGVNHFENYIIHTQQIQNNGRSEQVCVKMVWYMRFRVKLLYSKSMHTNNSFHALDTFPPPVCYNNNKKLPHNLRRGFLLIRKPLLDWLHSPLVCQDALDTQFWRIWVVAPRTSGSIRLDLGQRIRVMPIKYSWTDINQKNVF